MHTPTSHARNARRASRRRSLLSALAVLALGVLVPASQLAAQGARVAYVDMKRLLDNAPQMQDGRETLAREFARRDNELKAQEQRLAEMEDRQRRESALLPRDVAEARQQEIDALRRSVDRVRLKLREDLSVRTNEETRKRWDEINDVVVAFAREQKFDLVVQSPVIYASASIDVTDQILERLRRKAPVAQSR